MVGDLPAYTTGAKGKDLEEGMVHLAASISVAESMNDPDKYERVNYEGSKKVLDWASSYNHYISSSNKQSGEARGPIRKVVAASSAAIYGDPDTALLPLKESTPYGGKSPYADTKYRMEGLMKDFVLRQNHEKSEIGRAHV